MMMKIIIMIIIIITLNLKSLCSYSDPYILVKRPIAVPNTAVAGAAVNNADKKVIFKNCAALISCITKINNTQVDCAQDIDIVMPV